MTTLNLDVLDSLTIEYLRFFSSQTQLIGSRDSALPEDVQLAKILTGSAQDAQELLAVRAQHVLDTNPFLAFGVSLLVFCETISAAAPHERSHKTLEFIQAARLADLISSMGLDQQHDAKALLMKLVVTLGSPRPATVAPHKEITQTKNAVAETVYDEIIKTAGVAEPGLPLLLRYLCLVQNMLFFLKGGSPLFDDVSRHFLLPDASQSSLPNSPLLANESGTDLEDASIAINDEEVAILAQAAGIAPRKARSVLRRGLLEAAGSSEFSGLEFAMKRQVSSLSYDRSYLYVLARDYCEHRGLSIRDDLASDDGMNDQGQYSPMEVQQDVDSAGIDGSSGAAHTHDAVRIRECTRKALQALPTQLAHFTLDQTSVFQTLIDSLSLILSASAALSAALFAIRRIECLIYLMRGRLALDLGSETAELWWARASDTLRTRIAPHADQVLGQHGSVREISYLLALKYPVKPHPLSNQSDAPSSENDELSTHYRRARELLAAVCRGPILSLARNAQSSSSSSSS
ncbi:hypothetical protein BC831DRAFT_504258, partial [Entophlyctis helioformis]